MKTRITFFNAPVIAERTDRDHQYHLAGFQRLSELGQSLARKLMER